MRNCRVISPTFYCLILMFSSVWSKNLALISATSRRIICGRMSSATDADQLPDGSKVCSCKHSSEKSGKINKMNCGKKEVVTRLNCKRTAVDWDKLSDDEKVIFLAHNAACHENGEIYIDPATGYSVLTEKFLRQRGTCCGNACRHCPFGHENVAPALKTKKFNSAFYV